MDTFSEIVDPIRNRSIFSDQNSDKMTSRAFWKAAILTLSVHLIVGGLIYFFVPQRTIHRISHPLEAIFLNPPQNLPPKPPPPTPRPKVVRLEKPEPKPLPPPIAPVAVQEEPSPVKEEAVLPVSPPEEPPAPEPGPPVEEPLVLPEFDAAYLRNMPPPYPALAKRMGIQGSVRLRAFISPAGLPQEVIIIQSSGSPTLDDAALRAVRGWSFVPARKGTEAVAAWVEIPINFSLIKK